MMVGVRVRGLCACGVVVEGKLRGGAGGAASCAPPRGAVAQAMRCDSAGLKALMALNLGEAEGIELTLSAKAASFAHRHV